MSNDVAANLAIAHWSYIEATLRAHDVDDGDIKIAAHHYRSAFVHGYKHGIEVVIKLGVPETEAKPPTPSVTDSTEAPEIKSDTDIPDSFRGWSVVKDEDCIFLSKTGAGGAVSRINIGNEWNPDIAKEKIERIFSRPSNKANP